MTGPADGPVSIGIDFGTESGRVLLLDLSSGDELAVATVAYPHGVLDARLPSGTLLPPSWALQDPHDYMHVVRVGIPEALAASRIDAARVVGLGIDVTSCTVLPARADGTPLCALPEWAARPHAWVKLWKHHAAQTVADRMTAVAQERAEAFLARYGGRISSEWYFPKLIEIFEEDHQVYEAMDVFVEATDWIVWQLTGRLVRSACPASYKALWSPTDGLPPSEYFTAVAPGFDRPAEKLGTHFAPLGSAAGTITPELAAALGLPPTVAVAVGNVDSFVSPPGCGVTEAGVLVSVIGTSTCDMVIDDRLLFPAGMTGVAASGIVPGRYGYEAGQAAVGDMLGWYVERVLGLARSGENFAALEAEAAELAPGAAGMVALDWWNGSRSILADASLSGVVAGLTLHTTRGELYRTLLEAIAFGARTIVETFRGAGVGVHRVVACGGLAERSPLLMQLIADIGGLAVEVPASNQVPARGAALFGAVAAGTESGGFADIVDAAARLAPGGAACFAPDPGARSVYDELYAHFRCLHDELGGRLVEVLHGLGRLRHEAVGAR